MILRQLILNGILNGRLEQTISWVESKVSHNALNFPFVRIVEIRERMDNIDQFFQASYYNIIRVLLSVSGLWPFHTRSRRYVIYFAMVMILGPGFISQVNEYYLKTVLHACTIRTSIIVLSFKKCVKNKYLLLYRFYKHL